MWICSKLKFWWFQFGTKVFISILYIKLYLGFIIKGYLKKVEKDFFQNNHFTFWLLIWRGRQLQLVTIVCRISQFSISLSLSSQIIQMTTTDFQWSQQHSWINWFSKDDIIFRFKCCLKTFLRNLWQFEIVISISTTQASTKFIFIKILICQNL